MQYRTGTGTSTTAHCPGRGASRSSCEQCPPARGIQDFSGRCGCQRCPGGQTSFGENYVQEGIAKITALREQGLHALQWHCIGPVQSRKTAQVAAHFDWMQSLNRLDIAQRLSRQRPPGLSPLQVCLQVNIDGGANKSGVTPAQALELAQAVQDLPGLQLRGLMSIPEPYEDPRQTLEVHRRTRTLFDEMGQILKLPLWDTLSMGMSQDLELAITAGSTMVRVGSAIFGARTTQAG